MGNMTGHSKEAFMARSDSLRGTKETRRLLDEMVHGSFASITEAVVFVQRSLDPKLLAKEKKAVKMFPFVATMKGSDEAYSIPAILINAKTELRCDTEDLMNGLAILAPFEDVEGGDFCAPNLARKFTFGAGDICALRGRELRHLTNSWTGAKWYCFVHAFHESVMKQSEKMSEPQLDARASADIKALQAYESGGEANEEEAEEQETILGADSESPFADSNGPAKLSKRKRKTVIYAAKTMIFSSSRSVGRGNRLKDQVEIPIILYPLIVSLRTT
ncbi:hypothetical protein OEA41_005359 [Lepraria neglecta]|uniref:Uncharacterized protein n=1 Tax=Lepraria neglecta TaxID=209136 RepID=A0AAE0DGL9_9LECA|nr:hypothetical protein OEA41_005359 [Lepraria neglecta]